MNTLNLKLQLPFLFPSVFLRLCIISVDRFRPTYSLRCGSSHRMYEARWSTVQSPL